MDTEQLESIEDIEITNKKHLVAFLDILGFKSHVKNYLKPNNEDKEILKNIKSAFEKALNPPYTKFYKRMGIEIQYKQFSDCTCWSIPDLDLKEISLNVMLLCSFIHLLNEFYFNMYTFNLYIRGGVSVGFHYEDDNMIFSEGLIKAYELESKAIYPRIILDDELIERLKYFWTYQKDTVALFGIDKLLVLDREGLVFINPFSPAQSFEKMILSGDMEKPTFYDESKDLKTNLVDLDKIIQMREVKRLENEIEKLKLNENIDNRVLEKYLWLKELIKWNLDSKSSKIKFEYLLK